MGGYDLVEAGVRLPIPAGYDDESADVSENCDIWPTSTPLNHP